MQYYFDHDYHEVTQEEHNGIINFNSNRIAFACDKTNFYIKINDPRDHPTWLQEDYNVSIEEYEKMPRGYIRKEDDTEVRIQLYIGSEHGKIGKEHFYVIPDLIKLAYNHFGNIDYCICNGVIQGKFGEIWRPDEIIGELYFN